jgi:hypothetical protein
MVGTGRVGACAEWGGTSGLGSGSEGFRKVTLGLTSSRRRGGGRCNPRRHAKLHDTVPTAERKSGAGRERVAWGEHVDSLRVPI